MSAKKKKVVSRPVAEWTVDQVCSWLDACGHDASISTSFRRQAVDGQKLLALTKFELLANENLIDLGVTDEEARSLLAKDISNLKSGHATVSHNPRIVEAERDKNEQAEAGLKQRQKAFDPGFSSRSQGSILAQKSAVEPTVLKEVKNREGEIWGVRAETEQLKKELQILEQMEEVLQNVTQVQAKKINQVKEGRLNSREKNLPVLPFGNLSVTPYPQPPPTTSHRGHQNFHQRPPMQHTSSWSSAAPSSSRPHLISPSLPPPPASHYPPPSFVDPSALQGMSVADLMSYAAQSVSSIQRLQQQVEEVSVIGEHRALQGVQALEELSRSVSELRREMTFRSQQQHQGLSSRSDLLPSHPDSRGSGMVSLRQRPGVAGAHLNGKGGISEWTCEDLVDWIENRASLDPDGSIANIVSDMRISGARLLQLGEDDLDALGLKPRARRVLLEAARALEDEEIAKKRAALNAGAHGDDLRGGGAVAKYNRDLLGTGQIDDILKDEEPKHRSTPVSEWTPKMVSDWAKESRLSDEVIGALLRNMVDGEQLLALQPQDVRELGIGAMGERKRLHKAAILLREEYEKQRSIAFGGGVRAAVFASALKSRAKKQAMVPSWLYGMDEGDGRTPDSSLPTGWACEWTCAQVCSWLQEKAFVNRLVDQFRSRGINGRSLLALKHSDLVEMEIDSSVVRKRLLLALAELGANEERKRSEQITEQWTLAQVGQWLRREGFDDRVVRAFYRNDIDGTQLLALNVDLLEKIGIDSLGKRNKIATAISELRRLRDEQEKKRAEAKEGEDNVTPEREETENSKTSKKSAVTSPRPKGKAAPTATPLNPLEKNWKEKRDWIAVRPCAVKITLPHALISNGGIGDGGRWLADSGAYLAHLLKIPAARVAVKTGSEKDRGGEFEVDLEIARPDPKTDAVGPTARQVARNLRQQIIGDGAASSDIRQGNAKDPISFWFSQAKDCAVEDVVPKRRGELVREWNAAQVLEWGERVGLPGALVATLDDHGVDGLTLLGLTGEDLVGLNVKAIIARKRVLHCINDLKRKEDSSLVREKSSSWTVKQVGLWLHLNGVDGEITRSFEEQEVDGRALHSLNAGDLRDLGVSNEALRVRLARGIVRLKETEAESKRRKIRIDTLVKIFIDKLKRSQARTLSQKSAEEAQELEVEAGSDSQLMCDWGKRKVRGWMVENAFCSEDSARRMMAVGIDGLGLAEMTAGALSDSGVVSFAKRRLLLETIRNQKKSTEELLWTGGRRPSDWGVSDVRRWCFCKSLPRASLEQIWMNDVDGKTLLSMSVPRDLHELGIAPVDLDRVSIAVLDLQRGENEFRKKLEDEAAERKAKAEKEGQDSKKKKDDEGQVAESETLSEWVSDWNSKQVRAWLLDQGLEGALVDNLAKKFNGEALLSVTDAALQGLGIHSLGFRNKLLRGVAALKEAELAPLREIPVSEWSPRLVQKWLGSVGIPAEVIGNFKTNDIDGTLLLDLPVGDIESLCGGSMGAGHKVLTALNGLKAKLVKETPRSESVDLAMAALAEEETSLKEEDPNWPSDWSAARVRRWLKDEIKPPEAIVAKFATRGVDGATLLGLSEPDVYALGIETIGVVKRIIEKARTLKVREDRRLAPERSPGWDPMSVSKWLERQTSLSESVQENMKRHEFNGEQFLALSEPDLLRAGVEPKEEREKLFSLIDILRKSAAAAAAAASASIEAATGGGDEKKKKKNGKEGKGEKDEGEAKEADGVKAVQEEMMKAIKVLRKESKATKKELSRALAKQVASLTAAAAPISQSKSFSAPKKKQEGASESESEREGSQTEDSGSESEGEGEGEKNGKGKVDKEKLRLQKLEARERKLAKKEQKLLKQKEEELRTQQRKDLELKAELLRKKTEAMERDEERARAQEERDRELFEAAEARRAEESERRAELEQMIRELEEEREREREELKRQEEELREREAAIRQKDEEHKLMIEKDLKNREDRLKDLAKQIEKEKKSQKKSEKKKKQKKDKKGSDTSDSD